MKRVLFADNDPDFLNTRAEFLEKTGYSVLRAPTLAYAEHYLHETWSPVIILDIRLVDDDDEKDLSGLVVAKMETCRAIVKIVLTAYPTHEIVRELLRLQRHYQLAVNVLSKEQGPEEMIREVERAFDQHVRINWNIAIHWNKAHPLSFSHLANLIEPNLQGERLSNRADELEDLFRRLFYEKTQITIERLLWQQQGRIAVTVFTFAPDKPSESVLIICGSPTRIQTESENYKQFAPAMLHDTDGATLSALKGAAETTHFAAYALAGAPLESFQTFAEFYHSGPDQKSFRWAVDSLRATLATWNRGERVLAEGEASESQLLREKTGLDELGRSGLEERILTLRTEAVAHGLTLNITDDMLTLHLPGDYTFSYANPLPYVYATDEVSAASCAIAPGTLTPNNILIAPEGQVWLTDFSDIGPAPLLWNFTELEAAIRFDLVESDNLLGLHEMERRLTEPGRIGQVDSRDVDKPIRVALQSIESIRRATLGLIDRDARSYHLGLLFQAAGRVAAFQPGARRTRKEVVLALHALLAAGMICERVLKIEPPDSADEPTGLWIDFVNRVVRVDGKEKDLTPTEFKILECLHKNAGRLCTRQDVFKCVWGEEYQPDNGSHNSRLDSNMDRLRRKLEPDPDSPRYLIVKRGVGYQLNTKPGK